MPFPSSLSDIDDDASFDVIVVGGGGAGLSAAVLAAGTGARVAVVESTEHVGGTTAYSAATTWVPGTRLGRSVNPGDDIDAAARFLDRAVGDHADRRLRQALLDHGAAAIDAMEACSHVKYRAWPFHPDYLSELDDSTTCGRALEPLPFDGRLLGEHFGLVRPPIPEFTVLGGMMVDRTDIQHLLNYKRSLSSLIHVGRILMRHLADRSRHARGTRLVMGNALIARLLMTLKERGITLLMETRVLTLDAPALGQKSTIDGVTVRQGGLTRRLKARGGVILATGGFNRHPQLRAALIPGVSAAWCPGAPGHTGEALDLAREQGATLGNGGLNPCFWAPVSMRRRANGETAVFPHFAFDRGKPHMIAVDGRGERFVNESTSYHLFGLAMQRAGAVPAYLITDSQGMRRYGLGMVRPKGMGLKSALADGYVTRGDTLAELAVRLGLPAQTLSQTVERFNDHARHGSDPDFNRGATIYQRALGDATAGQLNPCLGAVDHAPFYAVKLFPGDIGAAAGLVTDGDARVLDTDGQPIAGLYAGGNDMETAMGGTYPGPGITIGPGLVFAYLAARDAVARARGEAPSTAMNRGADMPFPAPPSPADTSAQAAAESTAGAAR